MSRKTFDRTDIKCLFLIDVILSINSAKAKNDDQNDSGEGFTQDLTAIFKSRSYRHARFLVDMTTR